MFRRSPFSAYWVLWICLVMSVLAFFVLRWSVRREARQAFASAVQQIQAQIDFRVERYEDVLLQTRAHFENEDEPSRKRFEGYITSISLSERFPGVQAIGYVKRLSGAELSDHELRMRREGFASYRVWPRSLRKDYFPITYIEPADWRNQRALGFDMFTEDVRQRAMARARDEGRAVMSHRVVLVQETERDRQYGFLMYVPIYRAPGVPASIEERRDSLVGYVYSPFRADEVFSSALRGYDQSLLDIHIYASDQADPQQIVYDHNVELNSPEGLPAGRGLFRDQVSIQVPGGKWTMVVGASQSFVPVLSRLIPYLAALAGFLITYLLYSMVRSQEAYGRSEVEARRTLELVNEVGRTISAELDLDRLVQSVIRIATQLTKASSGAFVYSVEDESGEWITLTAVSGMEREELEHFPLAHSAGLLIRSGDIRSDLRFMAMNRGSIDRNESWITSFLSVPVTSRSGEPIGALLFGHPEKDVFTRREELIATGLAAQAAVAIDNARLYRSSQEAIQARDEFLSICSHELKTPLTSLKLQTQMYRRKLKSGDPSALAPERMEKLTQTSERQIDRLSQLVEDMLDIARISSGRLTIRPERVELYSLVAEMIERVMPSAGEAQTPIRLHGPASSVLGNWDRLRIEQVVLNLLSNAVKYGEHRPVDVSIEQAGDEARLVVHDQGMGIDQANQKRIFERFERAISATNISGLGLGLYIVRQILEAHQGTIELESELGHGATFTVHLPLNPDYSRKPAPASFLPPRIEREPRPQVNGSAFT